MREKDDFTTNKTEQRETDEGCKVAKKKEKESQKGEMSAGNKR